MIKIEVKGLKETMRFLSDLQKNQLPYATARALTQTAKDIQQEIIKELPHKFTLRTSWYKSGPYAFKITPALKTKLQATVYTKAPFMGLQETGGTKIAHGGKKYIAIPTDNVRRNKSRPIPQNLRPSALLKGVTYRGTSKKKGTYKHAAFTGVKAFIGEIHGQLGIWQRIGPRAVKLMYLLREEADIQPRLEFERTARRIAEQKFSQNWGRAMNEAVKSAK
ncbi:MAG: hypothetical protein OEW04_03535 [Nitrospirota bacterium]|nr:hypothetical protein [Nitrospirota bacterium]